MQVRASGADDSPNEIVFCLHNHEADLFYRVVMDRRRLKLEDSGEYSTQVRLDAYPEKPEVRAYFDSMLNVTRAYTTVGVFNRETDRREIVPCEQFYGHWNDKLRAALAFTDADYKANAAGTITDAQYNIMFDRIQQSRGALWAVAGVMGVLVVIFAFTVRLDTDIPYWFFAAGFAPLFAFLFIGEIRTQIAVRRAMQREQLKRVTGTVKLFMQTSRTKNGRTHKSYGMWVGRKRFDNITLEVREAMVEGETYDVHWLPGTHRILSAKLLD